MIARVMHGGAADRSGLIHVGDEIQEVNGVSVLGKTPNDVLKLLVRISNNLYFVEVFNTYRYIFTFFECLITIWKGGVSFLIV